MELSYRRAQLLELSQILAQCFENVNRYGDFTRVGQAEALSAVRRRVQKQVFNFTVAEKDGEAVGCYHMRTADGRTELEDFYVFGSCRGQGIGTQMLRDCQAKVDGAIWLRVFAGNVRAIGFFIRLGFHICGEAGTACCGCSAYEEISRPRRGQPLRGRVS